MPSRPSRPSRATTCRRRWTGTPATPRRAWCPRSLIPDHVELEDTTVRTIAAYFLELHRQIRPLRRTLLRRPARLRRSARREVRVETQGRSQGQPQLHELRRHAQGGRAGPGPHHLRPRAPGRTRARRAVHCRVGRGRARRDTGRSSSTPSSRTRRARSTGNRCFGCASWRLTIRAGSRRKQAITDAIRVIGSASYIRCYVRASPQAPWLAITIDMSGQPLPERLGLMTPPVAQGAFSAAHPESPRGRPTRAGGELPGPRLRRDAPAPVVSR